jgi:hypothetical protein
MSQTFEQYVISTYGKSIYQVELEIAQDWFVNNGTFCDQADAVKALDNARSFLRAMRSSWRGRAFKESLVEYLESGN